jgi:hypothetical protein
MTIKKLVAGAKGAAGNSTGADIADAVNGLIDSQAQRGKYSPVIVADFSAEFPAAYSVASGTPNLIEIAVCPYNGKKGLHIVSNSANATVQIQFPSLANTEWNNEGYLMTFDSNKTYQQSPQLRVYSSSSNFYNYQRVLSLAAANGGDATGGSVQRIYNDSFRTVSGTPPATGGFVMTDCRLIFPTGTNYDMWIFGVGLGQKRKSRICIVWDDGRESSLTLGYPVLSAYGIKKQTLALIKDKVNDGISSATLGQCKAFINAGGAIVPHSPHTPNIVDQFPSDPAGAAAAMLECINYIKSLGLDTPRFDKCFVYPQGKYQPSLLNTSYLEEMKKIGIDIARISFMQDIVSQRNLDAHSRLGRLACTTIGHQYAGTSAAETTNINSVVQSINDCALYGVDCFLMLHSVTKLANSETDPYDITIPNLKILGAAIKAQVDAGNMEAVTMPELVIDGDNYWNQF